METLFFNITILVSIIWGLLFFVFAGLGFFIRRLFGLKINKVEDFFISFWLGWAISVAFLQIWHLFLKIDWRAFCLVAVLGAIGLFLNRDGIRHIVKGKGYKNWLYCLIFLLTVLWLANRVILPPSIYDTGLYHLPSIRWAMAFPIVPGLGNLSGFLAYNSSHFLYVAMLSFKIGPLAQETYRLANGLLMLALFGQIFLSYFRLFTNVQEQRVYHVFNSLLLLPALFEILTVNISNPTPDIPAFVLSLVLSGQLLAFLENVDFPSNENRYMLFFIAALSAVAITIKQGLIVMGLVSLLILILKAKKMLSWVVASSIIILLFWVIRGVMLSGYVAYPIPFGSFPVEWRVPYANVVDMANGVRAWGRVPLTMDYDKVLGSWDWFIPWVGHIFRNPKVVMSLTWLFIGCFLMLIFRFTKIHKQELRKTMCQFLLPSVVSIAAWFMIAPEPRYLGGHLWVVGAGTVAINISCFNISEGKKKLQMVFGYYLILFCTLCLTLPKTRCFKTGGMAMVLERLHIKGAPIFGPGTNHDFYRTPSVELKIFKTNSGLVIYVPKNEYQCWNAPLPCAGYPNAELALRKKGQLYSGFVINKEQIRGRD